MQRPSTGSGPLCRREMLAGFGRSAAGLALLTVAASACGSGRPEVDPLQSQADLATADAQTAKAAATAATPALVPALTQISAERSEHARALTLEIARAAGTTTPTAAPTTTTTAPAGPPPTVRDVVAALRRSADSAAQLAATSTGYRAGLLGSISASCTAAFAVALNAPRELS